MPFKFSWGARTIFDDLTFEKFEKSENEARSKTEQSLYFSDLRTQK